jgi:hypothetical protein
LRLSDISSGCGYSIRFAVGPIQRSRRVNHPAIAI